MERSLDSRGKTSEIETIRKLKWQTAGQVARMSEKELTSQCGFLKIIYENLAGKIRDTYMLKFCWV